MMHYYYCTRNDTLIILYYTDTLIIVVYVVVATNSTCVRPQTVLTNRRRESGHKQFTLIVDVRVATNSTH